MCSTCSTLEDLDRRGRFIDLTLALLKAFALVSATPPAATIRDNFCFLSHIRAAHIKESQRGEPRRGGSGGSEALDTAIAQLVSQAVATDRVIDVYAAAGMDGPISQSCLTHSSRNSARRIDQTCSWNSYVGF